MAEVLHLAGSQHTAHPQELGSRPWGAQASTRTIPERLTHSRGQAGAPLWLQGLGLLADHRSRCRVPGLQAIGKGPSWRLPGPGGLPAPALAAGQRARELQVEEADATEGDG